jgi:hypothetical protein
VKGRKGTDDEVVVVHILLLNLQKRPWQRILEKSKKGLINLHEDVSICRAMTAC